MNFEIIALICLELFIFVFGFFCGLFYASYKAKEVREKNEVINQLRIENPIDED